MKKTILLLNRSRNKKTKSRRKIFELKGKRSKEIRLITRKEKAHFNRIDKNIEFLKDTILAPIQSTIFEPYIKPALESAATTATSNKKYFYNNDDNFILRRLTTNKPGPKMDIYWWIYNYLLLCIPAGLLCIFLEYQTNEMHRILGNMDQNDKSRLLGAQTNEGLNDGSYYYNYDEALLRLEYDSGKSDIQKRTEKKMIQAWKEKDEQGTNDSNDNNNNIGYYMNEISESLKYHVSHSLYGCYNYINDLYHHTYNSNNHDKLIHEEKVGEHIITTTIDNTTTTSTHAPIPLPLETTTITRNENQQQQLLLQKEEESAKIINNNAIVEKNELDETNIIKTLPSSSSWWNTILTYVPYANTYSNKKNDNDNNK